MNMLLIAIGLSAVGAVIALVASWRRAELPTDMGSVSHQWIAEHRQDSRR